MEKSTVSTKSVSRRRLLSLCEGAICIAMAYALSFLEIPIGVNGGSLSPAMIPILIFAIRNGAGMGIAAGFLFGIIKFFLAGGTALNWQSMLLDYSVAYAAVGLGGLVSPLIYGRSDASANWKKVLLWGAVGTIIGCAARFLIHYISGVTVYAEWMPEEFLGMTMTTPYFYSLLYNGLFMLPSTVLAVVITPLLLKALGGIKPAKNR